MTDAEACIARIAAMLGRNGVIQRTLNSNDHVALIEKFIDIYHPERPCQYRIGCLQTGQCPNDIACNN
jgi:hypothetical protein